MLWQYDRVGTCDAFAGGGWRGFDPVHGTAVGDAHVALAASREASGAAPVEGTYFGPGETSRMSVELKIDVGP
jgi:transglutaminase-like putative cysteine protease